MERKEIIREYAKRLNARIRDAKLAYDVYNELMVELILDKRKKIGIPGLGYFFIKEYKDIVYYNHRVGKNCVKELSVRPKFKFYKGIRRKHGL